MAIVRLAETGTTLATRPLGAQLRTGLINQIKKDPALVIDCDGVLSVSYSFADEFAGRLAQGSSEAPPARIEVLNASDEVRSVLERAVQRRLEPLSLAN